MSLRLSQKSQNVFLKCVLDGLSRSRHANLAICPRRLPTSSASLLKTPSPCAPSMQLTAHDASVAAELHLLLASDIQDEVITGKTGPSRDYEETIGIAPDWF